MCIRDRDTSELSRRNGSAEKKKNHEVSLLYRRALLRNVISCQEPKLLSQIQSERSMYYSMSSSEEEEQKYQEYKNRKEEKQKGLAQLKDGFTDVDLDISENLDELVQSEFVRQVNKEYNFQMLVSQNMYSKSEDKQQQQQNNRGSRQNGRMFSKVV
eukprot:TRINITY_DN3342_c0_g1_i1.p2 TRINITY_DN3342_c0_g1~~TRINITY_DN3342_c0_g1_i1.p2  ORF type:complete len:157 (-),score=23.19 TRINITY_DN3342_c0_g1_i1:16-486(-)